MDVQNDQFEVLQRVTTALTALGIPYMLTGSIAYSFYVERRMTRDIDLVVEVAPNDAERLARALDPDFYCDPEGARRAAEKRGLFNAIDETRLVKVDFIVRKPEPFRLAEFVWARESGSAIQSADVRALAARAPGLDWQHLRHWADRLGVSAELGALRHV